MARTITTLQFILENFHQHCFYLQKQFQQYITRGLYLVRRQLMGRINLAICIGVLSIDKLLKSCLVLMTTTLFSLRSNNLFNKFNLPISLLFRIAFIKYILTLMRDRHMLNVLVGVLKYSQNMLYSIINYFLKKRCNIYIPYYFSRKL